MSKSIDLIGFRQEVLRLPVHQKTIEELYVAGRIDDRVRALRLSGVLGATNGGVWRADVCCLLDRRFYWRG